MNKLGIQKLNTSFFALGILGLFALGLVASPTLTFARSYDTGYQLRTRLDYSRQPSFQDDNGYNDYGYENTDDSFSETKVVNNYNYNNTYTNPKTQSTSNSTKSTTSNTKETTSSQYSPVKTTEDLSNLSASVIQGSGGFLPTGILDWILVGILILIIVILVRKVLGGEQKYHAEPLKHA